MKCFVTTFMPLTILLHYTRFIYTAHVEIFIVLYAAQLFIKLKTFVKKNTKKKQSGATNSKITHFF